MKDPYQVLGVARGSGDDDIKKVYRRLARELHPDLTPGDKRAEERFKEISAAYDVLSDPDKRRRFDAGEIDASGAEKRRSWRSAGGGFRQQRDDFNPFGGGVDDILAEMMRRKEKGRRSHSAGGAAGRGAEARHSLSVTFIEAATGTTRRITLVSGKELDIRIPAGTTDGQALRLKGQGHPGLLGGEAGDAFVDITVTPHPFFTRRERDILLELPISVQEAVLGGKVTVPTIDGKVTLSIPPGSNTGSVLRLKGKGIGHGHGHGDQLVTLKVVLPEGDSDFTRLVEKWGPQAGYDPRTKAGIA